MAEQTGTGTTLRFDLVAGLTAAAVVLPKAMAYATVAGLPVAVGLYTAFIPMLIYALLGSSQVLSVSSTTTLAILAGTELGLAVPDGDPARLIAATATLSALVGVLLVLARLLRLGFVANFISAPVLTGFKAGIGLVIVVDQLPKLFGVHVQKQGFFLDLLAIAQQLPETSLVTAAAAAATMLLLAPLLGLLPHATLAAVVIVYSVGLIQPAEFLAIRKIRLMEARWAIIAAFGVLIFGTLQGIVIAIVVSLIGLASQAAHPRVSVIARKRGADVLRPLSAEHPDDEIFPGLLIVRPEGRLFFVNAPQVGEDIRALVARYRPRVLVLDLSRVTDIEYSALQMLVDGDRRAAELGATLWLVGLNPGVLEVVKHSGLAERLGRERMLFNTRAAIARYQELPSIAA